MTTKPVILRLSATYHLNVKVRDRVRRGERLREGPNEDGRFTAPVSGVIESIDFDAGSHEFVVAIAPTP